MLYELEGDSTVAEVVTCGRDGRTWLHIMCRNSRDGLFVDVPSQRGVGVEVVVE
jgi:exosome complex RNA-binding protein Rrp4